MRSMFYRLAADLVMLVHLLFVLFVVLGGFLSLRWRWMPWVHLPIAIYGATIEFIGFYCPLTPLENYLRRKGGQEGYDGGFVENYLLRILYPDGLTRRIEIILGISVIVINAIAYWLFFRKQGA
jgi:hypothetical protein